MVSPTPTPPPKPHHGYHNTVVSASSNLRSADQMDLTAAREAIASLLPSRSHDDGSYGPLFIRLSWHCCATYCRHTKTGGSNGGTMRFDEEQDDGDNAGLKKAIDRLEKIYPKHEALEFPDPKCLNTRRLNLSSIINARRLSPELISTSSPALSPSKPQVALRFRLPMDGR